MKLFDINKLLAEKGKLCVSILLTTEKYSTKRVLNERRAKDSLHKAILLLKHSKWPKAQASQVESRLRAAIGNLEHLHLQEGLAVFVSPDLSVVMPLPVEVTEKVMMGDSFEIRDLAYLNQVLTPYYLLAVSKKKMRLLSGAGRELHEIVNDDFPKKYVEEFEYEHPSVGSSSSTGLKGFERDKSIMEESRTMSFFRRADKSLSRYVKSDDLLFIAGVEEEISNYKHSTGLTTKVAGVIHGNYDHDAVHPLAEKAWQAIRMRTIEMQRELIGKLGEDLGKRKATYGIRDVWKAANAGKGLTLLLEKDYMVRAYLANGNDGEIRLSPPAGDYKIINDAADDVIEQVIGKGGQVVIVENNDLQNFQHIALLLRFS